MSTPVRAFRCIRSDSSWWTEGKLYPVADGEVEDDDVGKITKSFYTWSAEDICTFDNPKFQEVWVWPDGTEVEVLE